MTFWDLTDGRAPHINGELHVLLLDNDADFPVAISLPPFFLIIDDDDDIYLKYYTKGICVDRTFSGFSNGDPANPDKTVSAAVNRAYDDMEIRIKSGTYFELFSISKHLNLVLNRGGWQDNYRSLRTDLLTFKEEFNNYFSLSAPLIYGTVGFRFEKLIQDTFFLV